MPDTKKLADAITGARLLLSAFYVWIGLSRGVAALPFAGWLLLANWTGDSVDGALARRSRSLRHTWIGDHDLQVDMSVATGLLVFLIAAGLLPVTWGAGYLLLWAVIFIALGLSRSLGMLAQAPVYGYFILAAIRRAPLVGWSLVAWILVAVVVTWPRFPREVVPGFLGGLRDVAAREHPPPRHRSPH